MLLLTLTACGGSWLTGEWTLDRWAVEVGDGGATFAAEQLDAGSIRFDGDGTWWESVALYDGPELATEAGWGVLRTVAWTYWTVDGDEIWLAWTQNYASPQVFVVTSREDGVEAVSTGSWTDGFTAAVPVVTTLTLSRAAP